MFRITFLGQKSENTSYRLMVFAIKLTFKVFVHMSFLVGCGFSCNVTKYKVSLFSVQVHRELLFDFLTFSLKMCLRTFQLYFTHSLYFFLILYLFFAVVFFGVN